MTNDDRILMLKSSLFDGQILGESSAIFRGVGGDKQKTTKMYGSISPPKKNDEYLLTEELRPRELQNQYLYV